MSSHTMQHHSTLILLNDNHWYFDLNYHSRIDALLFDDALLYRYCLVAL